MDPNNYDQVAMMTNPMREKFSRKARKQGRVEGVEQFIKLKYFVLKHPAWLTLRPAAVKVYLDLHALFNGYNNGKIHYSLNYGAKRLGMSKHTVQAALQQLIDHGFIACTKRGYFTGRQASTWRLTTYQMDGHPPSNEWKNFQPIKKRSRNPIIGVESILQELKND